MMRTRLILVLLTVAAATSPGAAAAEHYAISATTVAATIGKSGMQISPDQVVFPAAVVAATPAPALKIQSLQKLDKNRVLARLECVNREECLPFFVEIDAGQQGQPQIAALAAGEATSLPGAQPQSSALAVRSGSRVTLMLDGDHVHISIPAICLQGGAPGQMIRVTDTNHRLIYPAQVVDASLVKGKLK